MTPASSPKQIALFVQDELDSAALYDVLAGIERDARVAEVFRRLAATERKHADHWIDGIRQSGASVPPYRMGWRTRVLARMARWLGPEAVLGIIAREEVADAGAYAGAADRAPGMVNDERSHARVLVALSAGRGAEGAVIARLEGRHRGASGNALRAAVLGANDGLLSNLSLMMGVAGASLASRDIVITGLAGLLAGACSMALGEWLSVQSSRELVTRQIEVEREEIRTSPAEEEEELALIYQAKGLPETEAKEVAARLMRAESSALDTLAREELGLDPSELGGSAVQAAVASFSLFAVGALIPLVPFLIWSGGAAIVATLVASACGLFAIGVAITVLTGRSVWFSGGRQVLVGFAAAAVTFGLGRLIGVNVR